jgi:fatty acid desaturase
MNIPKPLKYVIALGLTPIWKWYYYSPNTFKELQVTKIRLDGRELPTNFEAEEPVTLRMLFFPKTDSDKAIAEVINPTQFMVQVIAPFLLSRFILLPAPLLLFPGALEPTLLFSHAVVNLVLAEMLTNVHGFITIVTNHAGSDLYKFRDEVQPKSGSFYVRQVVSSANYNGGSDLLDFSHGWLNYQIEHHVWPDLSMLQYQIGAPKLEEICQRYGVPYVKENVFVRLAKTLNIMVGQSSMREFPMEMEPEKDKARKGVTWKSTNGAIDDEE